MKFMTLFFEGYVRTKYATISKVTHFTICFEFVKLIPSDGLFTDRVSGNCLQNSGIINDDSLISFNYYFSGIILKFKIWGTFFVIFGTNALITFALAEIWVKVMLYVIKISSGGTEISFYSWFYEKLCAPVAGNLSGSLMFTIIQMLLLWSAALLLYRKKIMIRL